MKLKIIILTIIFSLNLTGFDRSTFNFLRNDYGARAAGLGGNTLILPDDPNCIFYNPSSLILLKNNQISFGYFKHLLDINSGNVGYGRYIQDFGYVGAGILYTNYGEFTKRNEFGDAMGNFSANEFALTISYANYIDEQIAYGFGIKYIFSQIEKYSSSAIGLDLGLVYTVTPERFYLATSFINLGTQLNPYINTRENLPTDFKIGFILKPEHLPLVINFAFDKLLQKQDNFSSHFRAFNLGGEFTISSNIQFRLGYNNEERQDLKIGNSAGLAGFSIGLGLKFENYKFDYAISSLGKIAEFHRISLGIILN